MTDVVAYAYVNHGRWVADCPFCPGAERVWPSGQLQRNDDVDYPFGITRSGLHCGFTGRTCPVVFPEQAPAIDAVLTKRPVEATRNWRPGETVADLTAENVEHGVAV